MAKCTIILVKDYAFLRLVQYKVDVNCQMQILTLSLEKTYIERLYHPTYISPSIFCWANFPVVNKPESTSQVMLCIQALLMNVKKNGKWLEYRQVSSGQLQIQLFTRFFLNGESMNQTFSFSLTLHKLSCYHYHEEFWYTNVLTNFLIGTFSCFYPLYSLFLLLNNIFAFPECATSHLLFPNKMWKYKYFPF